MAIFKMYTMQDTNVYTLSKMYYLCLAVSLELRSQVKRLPLTPVDIHRETRGTKDGPASNSLDDLAFIDLQYEKESNTYRNPVISGAH